MDDRKTTTGTYTTTRDGGLTYTYEASWRVFGKNATWHGKVLHQGKIVASPSGQIWNVGAADLTDQVQRQVELTIERRAALP
jgi:hypothetical protein